MAMYFSLPLIPMTREVINAAGDTVDKSSVSWIMFPQEVEERMEVILRPYGYESDSDEFPDAGAFLLQIEYICRNEAQRIPWAIIFFTEEYPLAGHLLSIRPNRDIRFSSYSLVHPHQDEPYDPANDGPPPVSTIFTFSKSALMDAAATNSPLLN